MAKYTQEQVEERIQHFERVIAKLEMAKQKLEVLRDSNPDSPHHLTIEEEVEEYMGDIGEDLRSALGYFF
jgi:division protein CdvB (Snf7/Vps24/ESCRT-III family)